MKAVIATSRVFGRSGVMNWQKRCANWPSKCCKHRVYKCKMPNRFNHE
ncbi:Uncharacterised protein [Vibrio cholerae]|nr:Uncharacterised protein [Vibrio cholerae]